MLKQSIAALVLMSSFAAISLAPVVQAKESKNTKVKIDRSAAPLKGIRGEVAGISKTITEYYR